MDVKLKGVLVKAQTNEITEHHIYKRLAKSHKNKHNKRILERISRDELRHYNTWKKITNEEPKPKKLRIWFYFIICRILGLTFGVRLMERGEKNAHVNYHVLSKKVVQAKKMARDEEEHEQQLIGLLKEKRLSYAGSVVLGLNDALVELTGALAGFTLAFQNTRLIAIIGLITGVAASLSMAASEYLSTKTDGEDKHPASAAFYTGIAYIGAVLVLIFPYFLLSNVYAAFGLTLFNAMMIILLFTFYISIAKRVSFSKRFFEMAVISLSVASISFLIGYLIRVFFGVEI
jgi:vacuolar iron transporter family protein